MRRGRGALMVATRIWTPAWPCPVGQVWSTWRRGAGDPTYRITGADGVRHHWRGLRTPEGAATLAVRVRGSEGVVEASAWGEGAAWALEHVPAMLGADDDPTGFTPRHPLLVAAHRAHPHFRVGRGGVVMAALVPAVIEQKVTGQEAFAGFRRLVRRFGTHAPGAPEEIDLWLPPTPEELRHIPSWEWLRLGIDHARSTTVLRAASVSAGLERTLAGSFSAADARLRTVPGIGVWTSAEVRSRAHGDPDAVAFGDYHVARNIGWALIGEQIDDDALLELLEPYRGQRYRVQRLLELAGHHHPRHGARMAPRTHLPR
ncbi:DNA-3-methyladenine glycosylase family protein [Propioniciclava soli]|uniref:DNA-3-methyladenine glycosylase family protein n=1 Tax=Propioniciclava soli TaxID=2775081 RepID=UPI001E2A4EF3